MAILDGPGAVSRMVAKKTNVPGMCLNTVWQAFGSHNSVGPHAGQYPTALCGWDYATERHPGGANPPRGVPVYFGVSPTRTDANKSAGDVVLSLGGGQVVATDVGGAGRVGTTTIAARAAQISRPYLGWAGDFLGYTVDYPGRATAAAPFSKGTIVLHSYHYEDRVAKPLAAGATVRMKAPDGSDRNIIGGVGTYSLTTRLYGDEFAPGDAVDVTLVWYDVNKKTASNHYVETAIADASGKIRHSTESKCAAASGTAVYVNVAAHPTNQRTGTISLIDSDTYLFG